MEDLQGVVRQRLINILEPHIPYALQSRLLPVVEIYLQNGKRPKEHTFEGRLTRFWQLYHERHRPTYGRIDIHQSKNCRCILAYATPRLAFFPA